MQAARGSTRPVAVSTMLAAALAAVVLLTLLGHKLLTDWDEGIYAVVSREMLSSGWLVPHWNGQLWFEKPPLTFWVTAAYFKLFGVNEFWARAGSAFSGIAIVALLHAWLLGREGRLAAWLGTVILLSAFGFQHVCRVGETDVLLSFGCCIAVCGLAAVEQHERGGWLLFWGGFAVATMSKGGASVVLPITLVAMALLGRWSWHHFGLRFWTGLLLFLAAVLPWHLFMLHRFGQPFLAEYLGYHVLGRASHAIEGHTTHPWFYLWVLLVSAPPFALLYPFAAAKALRRPELRAWAVFALVVVVFFSIVQTRLPHYIAPAYPAFAVVTAVLLADWLKRLQTHRPSSVRLATYSSITVVLSVASILLTAHGRGALHRVRMSDGKAIPGDPHEPAILLRHLPPQSRQQPGPLLVWWSGDTRSIATSVFYAGRTVVQVGPDSLTDAPRDRYTHDHHRLDEALGTGPRLLLLENALLPGLPPNLVYTPLVTGQTMQIGSIERRGHTTP